MTMKNCDAGERGAKKQKNDQHGKIVSAEIMSDANGHVKVPAGFVVGSAGASREYDPVAHEIVRCRKLIVEAPGRRVALPRMPIESRPATLLRPREQILDQGT